MNELVKKKGWINNYIIHSSKSDLKNFPFIFLREFYSFILSNNNPASKFLKFKMYLGICFLIVGEQPNELSV